MHWAQCKTLGWIIVQTVRDWHSLTYGISWWQETTWRVVRTDLLENLPKPHIQCNHAGWKAGLVQMRRAELEGGYWRQCIVVLLTHKCDHDIWIQSLSQTMLDISSESESVILFSLLSLVFGVSLPLSKNHIFLVFHNLWQGLTLHSSRIVPLDLPQLVAKSSFLPCLKNCVSLAFHNLWQDQTFHTSLVFHNLWQDQTFHTSTTLTKLLFLNSRSD